jgi:hypothetical protein
MATRFIKNYKLWFWTPLSNTIAGELFHKCVKKGKFKKNQRSPNYFLSKNYNYIVTYENRICIGMHLEIVRLVLLRETRPIF